MRIAGQRADGALFVALGDGLAVVLKGNRVTPTVDQSVAELLGPWTPVDNSLEQRRSASRALELARVASMDYFQLRAPTGVGHEEIELGLFGKKDDDEKKPGLFEKKVEEKVEEKTPGVLEKKVAVEEKKVEETPDKPVSDIAAEPVLPVPGIPLPGEPSIRPDETINLPSVNPVDDWKKKRGELREKLKSAARSKGRLGDTVGDDEITDDDLFALAKELKVKVPPGTLVLTDYATRYTRLLARTRARQASRGWRASVLLLHGDRHPQHGSRRQSARRPGSLLRVVEERRTRLRVSPRPISRRREISLGYDDDG